jgi:integrase/recombinase XerD
MCLSDVTTLAVEDLKGTQLSLYQTKTGEPISIALDAEDAEVLRSAVKLNSNPKYFFQTGNAKLQSAISNWRARIADVFEAANIQDGHTHRFRHTFAAELLSRGVLMERVSKLLGHESIAVTQKHYAQWVKGRQELLNQDVQVNHGWRKELESARPHMLN